MLGGPLGGFVGSSLGGLASTFLGLGKYGIKKNSLVQKLDMGTPIPSMHSSTESITIRHREYITDVTCGSSGLFTTQSFNLNPGLASTFPWLSGIAANFQEWQPKGIIFEYKTQSGNSVSSATTTLPEVMMSTQYRSTAPVFTNEVDMLQEDFATSGIASESFIHCIECDPRQNPMNVAYVRTTSVPSTDTQNTYDLGIFTIATIGGLANNVLLGKLYVTYEIELRKPYNGVAKGLTIQALYQKLTTATTASPVGTAFSGGSVNPWGAIFTTTNITIPGNSIEGTYVVKANYSAVTACTSFSWSVTNSTAGTTFWNGSANFSGSSTANGVGAVFGQYFTITNPAAATVLTPVATLTGATSVWFSIEQVNPEIIPLAA
jgi:hypothetical protein